MLPAMDEPAPPRYRVGHHAPDGTIRLLTASDLTTVALNAGASWARRLRRAGDGGEVVVIRQDTGEAVARQPVDPA